jgi:hypothetical protein
MAPPSPSTMGDILSPLREPRTSNGGHPLDAAISAVNRCLDRQEVRLVL